MLTLMVLPRLVLLCHFTEQAQPPGNNDPSAGSANPLWVAPLFFRRHVSQAAFASVMT